MTQVSKRDALGDRMKSRYEDVTRLRLPARTYTILRVDGRAFHTWTRGLDKPYDLSFMACMDATAAALCEEIAGARFAFVQSDEISLLATDFADVATQAWFDGNLQKWASVAASVATVAFNAKVGHYNVARDGTTLLGLKKPDATFDARVFTIPDHIEVENYFVWRQNDAVRNSVTMLAQHYASHKQLHGKGREQQHEVIHAHGDNWASHPARFKHGAVIRKLGAAEWGEDLGEQPREENYSVGNWFVDGKTPVFTRNWEYLRRMIPIHWEDDIIERVK